jgi:tetratricopeptide (TPR) repeat protein
MEAFAQQFSPASGTGTELELLQVLGLFNRPAPREAIARVTQAPAISGLTDGLAKLGEAEWLRLLHKRREVKLLAREYQHRPETLDCHPLVREHFGEKLRQQNPAAWKEAHSRLYEYYKNLPAKELPDTLEEMEPLFAAVAHGCQAGRHQETLDEVFYKRIERGDGYVVHNLGAINTTISSLSGFFDPPWQMPVPKLVDEGKAYILNISGFCLRALGRSREAIQALKAGLEASVALKDWEGAASEANNISELYLTLGEVQQAIIHARQSMDFAHSVRPFDAFKRYSSHTTLADALHQAGELFQAEEILNKAEFIQKRFYLANPALYGLAGFRLCDLLLSQGQYLEVQNRARQMREDGKEYSETLFDTALYQLLLGRAFTLQAWAEERKDFSQANDYLNKAVQSFREAGRQDYLPRGLFARAACYRAQNKFAPAWADLEEAREIAERGEMKLHLADYHLEACCLCLAQSEQGAKGKEQEAKEHLETASAMIEKMGYGRRKPEVEALRREIEALKI